MSDVSKDGPGAFLFEEALTGWAQLWGLCLEGAIQLGEFQADLSRAFMQTWGAWPSGSAPALPGDEAGAGLLAEELARAATAVGCPPAPLPE